MLVIIKVPLLKCRICSNEKEVPVCCEKSMLRKDENLLCCCKSSDCGYIPIPTCCNTKMEYIYD
jgi:hypothetical protein